jgi:hypothetical protein
MKVVHHMKPFLQKISALQGRQLVLYLKQSQLLVQLLQLLQFKLGMQGDFF